MKGTPLSPDVVDKILFPVTEQFYAGKLAGQIAKFIEEEYGVPLSREQVYPLLRLAVRRKYLLLSPPVDKKLTEVIGRFSNPQRLAAAHPQKGKVHVVTAPHGGAAEAVSSTGAEVTLRLIRKVSEKKANANPAGDAGGPVEVHLGVGVGRSTGRFVRSLAHRLRGELTGPPVKLVVHALCPAFPFVDPVEAPLASFGYLHEALEGSSPEAGWTAAFVGLFLEPLLPVRDYNTVIGRPPGGGAAGENGGTRNGHTFSAMAFGKRDEIDIVITSLAKSDDPHGFLRKYLELVDPDAPDRIRRRYPDWRGDVSLRPYSSTGPIPIEEGMKPVTLFEIPDLVKLAGNPDKHVVLLCGRCGLCFGKDQSKAPALLPLLTEPSLCVWDNVVLDDQTALEVVSELETQRRPAPAVAGL